MSKTISAALKAHLAGETLTVAMCWKITRPDGLELFFTDHDQDIVIDGDTYAAATGMLSSDVAQDRSLGVDTMEAMTFLLTATVDEDEVSAGEFDDSTLDVFWVNWSDLTQGKLYMAQNWPLGKTSTKNNVVSMEMIGLSSYLNQQLLDLFSYKCRARLGDSKCQVNLAYYTEADAVSTVTSRRQFTLQTGLTVPSSDPEVWTYGKLTWDTGAANAGKSFEVLDYDEGTKTITLIFATPYTIQPSDSFTISWGCDKDVQTCDDRFANTDNFRAEPYQVPKTLLPIQLEQQRQRRLHQRGS